MAQAYRFGLTMLSYFVLFLLHISLHLGHLTDAFFIQSDLQSVHMSERETMMLLE